MYEEECNLVCAPSGGLSGEMLLVQDDITPARDGCEAIANDIDGKIALVERGNCDFTVKVINAQNAGAIGVMQILPTTAKDKNVNIPEIEEIHPC